MDEKAWKRNHGKKAMVHNAKEDLAAKMLKMMNRKNSKRIKSQNVAKKKKGQNTSHGMERKPAASRTKATIELVQIPTTQ